MKSCVPGIRITFVDPDHVVQEWTYYEGGTARDVVKMTLSRVK